MRGRLTHKVVDLLQFAHTNRLEGCLDETAPEEVNGLDRVLSVSDVRSFDGDHSDHGLEDGSTEVGTGWQTDDDNGAMRSDVLLHVSATH